MYMRVYFNPVMKSETDILYMQNLLRLLCPTLYLSLSQSISPLQNDMKHPLTFIAFLTIVSRHLYYLFIVYFPVTSRFTLYMIFSLEFL